MNSSGKCPVCGGDNTRSLDGGIFCMDCDFPELSLIVKELVRETYASVKARLNNQLQ